MDQQHIFAVSEVNGLIKDLIDGTPQLSGLYIRGELSNYKIYPSGHHYFTLKDGQSALRCVMFTSSAVKPRFRPNTTACMPFSGRNRRCTALDLNMRHRRAHCPSSRVK